MTTSKEPDTIYDALTPDEVIEYDHVFRQTMAALGRNGLPHETNKLAAHDAASKIIRQYREQALEQVAHRE